MNADAREWLHALAFISADWRFTLFKLKWVLFFWLSHRQIELAGSFDNGAALVAGANRLGTVPEFVHHSMQILIDVFEPKFGFVN